MADELDCPCCGEELDVLEEQGLLKCPCCGEKMIHKSNGVEHEKDVARKTDKLIFVVFLVLGVIIFYALS